MTDQEKEDYIKKLFEEAHNFFKNNEFEKSLACIENVLKVDPDNGEAFSLRGVIFSILEKYEDAIEEYDKAIELFDDNNSKARVYSNKGKTLSYLKKYKEAVEAFDKAINCYQKENDKAEAYFNKGNAHSNLKDYKEAVEAFDEAINRYQKENDKAKAYFNKGNAHSNLKDYQKAVEAFDKAINCYQKENDKADAYFNKGKAFDNLKKYKEAVEAFDEAINHYQEKNDKAKAYFNKGIDLGELKEYKEGIEAFDEAINHYQEKNDKAKAYLNKGIDLGELKEYKEAVEAFDEASRLYYNNNDKAKAYFNKGALLYNLKDYKEAVEAFDKASRLYNNNNDKAKAYFNKGKAFDNIKKYKEGIKAFDEAINRCQKENDKAAAYFNKGILLYNLNEYQEGAKAFGKASKLYYNNNDKANANFNKGITLSELKEYKKAIKETKEALKLNPKQKSANKFIASCYFELKEWQKAGEFFGKEGIEIIEIISSLNEEDEKAHVSDIVCSLLKNKPNDYFWKVLERTHICKTTDRHCVKHPESCGDCKIEQVCGVYRDIYLKSLQIIAHVQVNFAFEEKVAHYTTKDSARILLLGKNGKKVSEDDKKPSLFRLASTARANDPKEGQTLFDYLLGNEQQTSLGTADSNYRAFIGCFTFNQQSLNQFRLYGKEKGREASGVSIVINKDYFNEEIEVTQNMKTAFVNIDKDIEPSIAKEDKKLSLFRCIYIDPETKAVISLGHKELYAYIREEMEKNKRKKVYRLKKRHATYLSKIEEQLDNVTELLEELKDLVSNPDLNSQTISELLLMLSHLVKHVAFKEEQECRILEIASLTEKNENIDVESEIDNNSYRMFIDYLSMTDSVDRLYMGNQFEDFAMFKDLIKQQYHGKVKCYISTHPFAIT